MHYTPGNEPEELKKHLKVLLRDLHSAFPEGLVVMDMWNHERWDKLAVYLMKKLGYPNGRSFLEAYGFEVFDSETVKAETLPAEKTTSAQKAKPQEERSSHMPVAPVNIQTSQDINTSAASFQSPKTTYQISSSGKTQKKSKTGGYFLAIAVMLLIFGALGIITTSQPRKITSSPSVNNSQPATQTTAPSPQITTSPLRETLPSKYSASDISVGDYVIVGNYEQDNNLSNGSEPIEWMVLGKDKDLLFLLSRYVLDCKPYNNEHAAVVWKDSTLYSWLNGRDDTSFLSTAFTPAEQDAITEKGKIGKVFSLSNDEVTSYFNSNDERSCLATEFAISQGISKSVYKNFAPWWTRSKTYSSYNAYIITPLGSSKSSTYRVDSKLVGVRPAVWIDVSAISEISSPASERAQATVTETPVPTSKPTPRPTATPKPGPSVGDYVTFGTYEQDNNYADGKEPIEWIVLDNDGGKMLLLSKYALDAVPYNYYQGAVTWESCSLREWLNNSFLNDAFTAEEQQRIRLTTVSADKHPKLDADPGKSTQDKVFLLSVTEVNRYFKNDGFKRTQGTEYAKARGCFVATNQYNQGNCVWWLRTPGQTQEKTCVVYDGGGVSGCLNDDRYVGNNVSLASGAARPAIWVDVSALNGKSTSSAPSQSTSTTATSSPNQTESPDAITVSQYYWNEPVDLQVGFKACFYDDGNGNYRFELWNPEYDSATIFKLLEIGEFSQYGLGTTMYRWMKHILDDHRNFNQQGNIAQFILNGIGGNNMFYFNMEEKQNGIIGLQLNDRQSMETMCSKSINYR